MANVYMGGCQNQGPVLGPLNTRCRVILRTQRGTIILTTTHIVVIDYQLDRLKGSLALSDASLVCRSPLKGFLEPVGIAEQPAEGPSA